MMMRIVKPGCLTLLTMILANGCSTAPPDDLPVPTAAQISTTSAQNGPGPADPDAPEEFTTTASGLKYRIRREGSGASPTRTDRVRCNYRGWLDDGTEFDSSYSREPFECLVGGNIIAGWQEGLQLVKEGGMIELEIPADLGYGVDGRPGIPSNATLHFTMELIEIL